MEIGLGLPQTGPNATREHVLSFARSAEEAGYDSLSISDHVVLPREFRSLHPNHGRLPPHFRTDSNLLEPLTTLAFVAAVTERIRLGTSVLVLPMRQPVLHAKIMASIDHLAGGGRVFVGAGAGWCEEEFEVLGASFRRRGKRIEEQVAVLRALWSGDYVDHAGEFYKVDGWISRPAPDPVIPVWLGGAGPAALRRAGRIGDGWFAGIYSLPSYLDDSTTVRRAAEEAGRDPSALKFSLGGAGRLTGDNGEETAQLLRDAASVGVQHARVGVQAGPEHSSEVISDFARRHLDDLHEL